MIGVRPLMEEWISGRFWADVCTDIFFACALMSGLHAIGDQPRQLRVSLLLVSSIIMLSALHYVVQIPVFQKLQQGLGAIFLMHMLVMIWKHIVTEHEITIDLIMAAACAYILLGMVWAYAYFFVESFHPGSFRGLEDPRHDLLDFYYYSFVTLTTLGYGDILAVTQPARGLSVVEAIMGQLYLALTISRLVGLHSSQSGFGKGK
jgi:hypothetical protein